MNERMTANPPTTAPSATLGGHHAASATPLASGPSSGGTAEDAKDRAKDVASTGAWWGRGNGVGSEGQGR